MSLHGDPGPVNGLNVAGVILVTLTFHHFSIGLVHKAACILNCLLRRNMKAPIGHIHHPQTIVTAPINCFGHHHDFIKSHRHGALVPKQDHPAGVRYAKNIDPEPVRDDRTAVIVNCHLHDLLTFTCLAAKLVDRDLSPGLLFSHEFSPCGFSVYVPAGNRLVFQSADCSTDHGEIVNSVIVDRGHHIRQKHCLIVR